MQKKIIFFTIFILMAAPAFAFNYQSNNDICAQANLGNNFRFSDFGPAGEAYCDWLILQGMSTEYYSAEGGNYGDALSGGDISCYLSAEEGYVCYKYDNIETYEGVLLKSSIQKTSYNNVHGSSFFSENEYFIHESAIGTNNLKRYNLYVGYGMGGIGGYDNYFLASFLDIGAEGNSDAGFQSGQEARASFLEFLFSNGLSVEDANETNECREGYYYDYEIGQCALNNSFGNPENITCAQGERYDSYSGSCVKIAKIVTLTPEKITLNADGLSSYAFEVKVTSQGNPIIGENVGLRIFDMYHQFNELGTISFSSVATDNEGKAHFNYTSPKLSQNNRGLTFTTYNGIHVQAIHENGNPYSTVILKSSVPSVSISSSARAIQETDSSGVINLRLSIKDIDSESFTYSINTNLGSLITGKDVGSMSKTISGEINSKTLNFRWLIPDSKYEVRDFEYTMDSNDAKAWDSLMNNYKSAANIILEGQDNEDLLISGFESQYDSAMGSIEYLKEDLDRMKGGATSSLEAALNLVDMGVEGLQLWAGTKSYIDDTKKQVAGIDESLSFSQKVKQAYEKSVGSTKDYFIDKLQSRLRSYADAERGSNLKSSRIPITINVTITDDTGLFTTNSIILYYTYNYKPPVYFKEHIGSGAYLGEGK